MIIIDANNTIVDLNQDFDQLSRKHTSLIIDSARQARDNLHMSSIQRARGAMNPEDFRREYGVVRYHGPRQTGHSMAALILLTRYADSILVVPTQVERDRARKILQEHVTRPELIRSLIIVAVNSTNDLQNIRYRANRPFLIFDQASRMIRTNSQQMGQITSAIDADIIVELQ